MQNKIKDKQDWSSVSNREPQSADRYRQMSQSISGSGDRESSVSSGELHKNFQVPDIDPGIARVADDHEWVTTCKTRKRPIKSFIDFVKRSRYSRSVCQWEPLTEPYTPVLNGSHGEVTESDDMSSSSGKDGNDTRCRRHKEAKSNRFSAGGSSRKGMGTEPTSNSEALHVSEEFDLDTESIFSDECPPRTHNVEIKRWGIYGEHDSFLKRLKDSIATYAHDVVDLVTGAPALEAAPAYVGVALFGGMTAAAVTESTQPFLGKWGSRILGVGVTSAIVAYTWFVDRDIAPELAGAGSDVQVSVANPTRISHVDKMSYTSWQEGEVYIYISETLVSEFTGCRVDEHLARRAIKRANELSTEISLHADRGILADSVSYALCILNVEMARVGVSLQRYSGTPSSSGWV